MTHDEAQREAERRRAEDPDALFAVQRDGEQWRVVRVAAPFGNRPTGSHTEARPRPPHADDPRPNVNPHHAGF